MLHRATRKLATLSFVRMPVAMPLVTALWALSLVLIPFIGGYATPFVGMLSWVIGMLLGLTLRTLMRTETLMLPNFRRHLAMAGLLHALILLALPALLMLVFGHGLQMAAMIATTLMLATSIGIAAGVGVQIAYFIWMIFIAAPALQKLPDNVKTTLMHGLTDNLLIPVLIALVSMLVLNLVLRPLLVLRDREDEDSPMQAIADGRKPAVGTTGMPQRLGFIGKKLKPILDATGQKHLEHALARHARKPTASSRMGVVRAVLLPHDNLQGMLINLVTMAVIGALYMLLIDHNGHMSSGFLASYALLLGLTRFPTVGRGMRKMQPSFADLFMTLAPTTHRQFQATLADALLKLVVISTATCVIFTAIIAAVLRDSNSAAVILTGLLVGAGASFAALAAHLIGPDSQAARGIVQAVIMGGAMGVYALVLWLMTRFGLATGTLAALVICVPGGLGSWYLSRRVYLGRRPCFDAPLD